MASKFLIWKILNVILVLPVFVCGKPACRTRFRTEVICVAGTDDYVLQKGLVSDNNQTAAITLKGCRITGVDSDAFKNVYSVQEIDLSQNKISALKTEVFNGMSRLSLLRLSKNLLTSLPRGLFDNLPRLQRLDLSNNKISSLESGIFNNLPELIRLELIGNALLGKDLDPSLFDRNPKMQFLRLSGNNMSHAPDQLFNAFRELRILDLNNCSLTEIPKFVKTPNMKTLERLSLQINKIRRLDDPSLFEKFEKLSSLDLISNEIEYLHEDVFKPLENLKVIDLSFNKIEHIQEKLFQNMPSVQSIDLSNNLIEVVPVNAFRGTRLKKLNLNTNQISYLGNNFLLELRNSATKLSEFNFGDNPFQCACLLDILNEVKSFGVAYNYDKYNGEHEVCVMTSQFTCMRFKAELDSIDMR
ncbi:leucine-rich repeat-containing protein 15 isoform X2 [Manduca sexta]|uniref:Uncharacterized protein n=2 Tax=Manduca sexta TaxID=7130 RepID=A0A922CKB7_MANSE|nr:leucine-rich repeat-containing protein 15 isoform X2 [Manduca sexta]XP_030023860.1 leucine-rich repeat-containing protein 15 isoform X2 [Manduca sexta]XP_030023861.1 leucine-rich repeat-containing protein 15 isoform X2 [Manduca sexta]XP_030023862.1 leucine-rich repeat-containing protein 15 isoform X2 [Manduca sexta]KAG6449043.1 hypothetical protein O3G_MSEX005851 [Manduca sexta]KAG6449044.1 hypothetical protein O3G_MSEX005851 [Manduca sexta]